MSSDHPWDPAFLRSEIAALDSGEPRGWPEIAQVIDEVERTRLWASEGATSLTDWIDRAASRWDRSRVTLWRYRGASRTVTRLIPILEALHLPTTALRERPGSYNPEALDVVWQLARLVDAAEFRPMAQLFLVHDITREALRRRLNQFRAVARSCSAAQPSTAGEGNRFARALIAALDKPRVEWLPGNPALLALVQRSALPNVVGDLIGPEITLVTKANGEVSARLHYVAYSERPLAGLADRYDGLWLASPAGPQHATPIPVAVGVLELRDGAVRVARSPGTLEGLGTRAGETARLLLGQILARRSARTRIMSERPA